MPRDKDRDVIILRDTKDIEDLCREERLSKAQLREKYSTQLDTHSKLLLSHKPVRSWSGVLVITVVMRPDKFSCPHNCYYCPNEPGQPRSYLSNEPAIARANGVNFDAVSQVHCRLDMLKGNGHTQLDKIEIIVLGGTFSAYPRDYQKEFITDLYYALNVYPNKDNPSRGKSDLITEQWINETAKVKLIGLSLETRPDHINQLEIKRLRMYGCTRVQLGVQHTDDAILKIVNRGHDNATSIKAISTLKANGFKVDLHIMPDLPGCNPEMDKKMMEMVLNSPNYSPDYLKIYPCLDVDFTEIKKWKESGKWVPYSENDISQLIDVILHAKKHSKYYTRFNRIQRDFSEAKNGAIGFQSKTIKTNLRQIVQNEAQKQGIVCKCIRCCEIKSKRINKNNIQFHIDTYNASFGIEKYISFYSDSRKTLHGFIRVRFNDSNQNVAFNKLKDCALIRELHVYGFVKKTCESNNNEIVSDGNQHVGFGKALLAFAEMTAVIKGYKKIAVISGVGVRNYYRRYGYFLQDEKDGYLVKEIEPWYTPYYIFRALWYYLTVLLRVWLLLRS